MPCGIPRPGGLKCLTRQVRGNVQIEYAARRAAARRTTTAPHVSKRRLRGRQKGVAQVLLGGRRR